MAHRLQVPGDTVAAVPALVLPAYPFAYSHPLVCRVKVRRGVMDERRANGRAGLAEEPPEAVEEANSQAPVLLDPPVKKTRKRSSAQV